MSVNQNVRSIAINMFNRSIQQEFANRLKSPRELPSRTDQVKAICQAVGERKRNVVVSALAGTGKTTAIEQSINDFAASARAQTCHSAGFSAHSYWLKNRKGVEKAEFVEDKVSKILRRISRIDFLPTSQQDSGEFIVNSARELVSVFKSQGFGAIRPMATDKDCYDLAYRYDIDIEGEPEWGIDPTEIFKLARKALEENNQDIKNIDYDDMIYFPVLFKASFFKNDLIYVDESQDLNPIRIAMIEQAAGDWAQVVFVGDRNQSIYGFTGADTEAMDSIMKKFDAIELPLSVCWRCSKAVIQEAQKIVPEIEHAPNAPEGSVSWTNHNELIRNIQPGDFVLCRTTAPVVETCLALIRNGKAATVRGRDIGKGLINLASKISRKRGNGKKMLIEALNEYREAQEKRLSAPGKERQLQSALDKVDTLIVLAEDCDTFDHLKRRIESIFANDNGDDTKNIILCSTVHKSKGLESKNVYVIRPELLPGPWASQPWQVQQEMNLKYVAITRAQLNLFWVESPPKDTKPENGKPEVTASVKPKRTRKAKATAAV